MKKRFFFLCLSFVLLFNNVFAEQPEHPALPDKVYTELAQKYLKEKYVEQFLYSKGYWIEEGSPVFQRVIRRTFYYIGALRGLDYSNAGAGDKVLSAYLRENYKIFSSLLGIKWKEDPRMIGFPDYVANELKPLSPSKIEQRFERIENDLGPSVWRNYYEYQIQFIRYMRIVLKLAFAKSVDCYVDDLDGYEEKDWASDLRKVEEEEYYRRKEEAYGEDSDIDETIAKAQIKEICKFIESCFAALGVEKEEYLKDREERY